MKPSSTTGRRDAQLRLPFRIDVHERARVVAQATAFLAEGPVTVTASRCDRSAGGLHDYYSEGDYWWPDPENPGGPFVRRDGLSYPDVFSDHRRAMRRLSIQSAALAAAHRITGEERFAKHTERHLHAWFVNPGTSMTPHLLYGQAISGITTGRCIGLVDTVHLIEVALAARHLDRAGALSPATAAGVRAWFRALMDWMMNDPMGIEERDHGNNHSTCWAAQVAAFALFLGDEAVLAGCRERFRFLLIDQMAPDGSFPLELARTRPYNYSLFNIELMGSLCHLASSAEESLWDFEAADGRSTRLAFEFVMPYILDKASWTYGEDVAYWEDFPIRNVATFLAALAYGRADWLEHWKTLPSDPTEDEVVRNMPMRQPVLWVGE